MNIEYFALGFLCGMITTCFGAAYRWAVLRGRLVMEYDKIFRELMDLQRETDMLEKELGQTIQEIENKRRERENVR